MSRPCLKWRPLNGDLYDHTILEYPEADHFVGYLLRSLPPGLLPLEITDEAADQATRAGAWPKAVEFIRKLGSLE
jgi:hypothetical protein